MLVPLTAALRDRQEIEQETTEASLRWSGHVQTRYMDAVREDMKREGRMQWIGGDGGFNGPRRKLSTWWFPASKTAPLLKLQMVAEGKH